MRPSSVNSVKALATDDWLGTVSMRIQRPSTRIWFTALKDCEPPDTCITARVLPWVGRTAPDDSGIQSICDFMTPVIAPWRSGEHQTMPSDQAASWRNSCTLGWRVRRTVWQAASLPGQRCDLGTHGLQQARSLEGQQAAVRALAQRAVEQQEARTVLRRRLNAEPLLRRHLEQLGYQAPGKWPRGTGLQTW